MKDEAKVEFAKASKITKAADDKLIDKMSGAREKPAPVQGPAGAQESK
jgi:hypothetical protein